MKSFQGSVIILLLIVIGGCAGFNDPDAGTILNVDNEFEIVLKEKLGESSRSVEFTITSLDAQECQESTLDLLSNATLNSLNIKIANIIVPAVCTGEGGYPAGQAKFNVAEREYDLQVEIQDIVRHSGTLSVNPDNYEVSITSAKGLILETSIIQKIPSNFAWGYYQLASSADFLKFSEFFNSNELAIRPLTDLKEGHYSYFDIDNQGTIIIEELPDTGTVYSFGLNQISLEDLKAAVAEFKSANSDVKMTVFGADGSVF